MRKRTHPSRPRRSRRQSSFDAVVVPDVLESLEDRRLLSVTIDNQGWTNVTPSPDSRIIYVSSSRGSDSNSGLSPDSPVKTIAKGRGMLRSGSPDWLLLKRGDVWYERYGGLNVSGRSQQEPILISAYGEGDRPLLNTRNDTAIVTNVTPVNHVAIIGINFNSNTADPNSPDYINSEGGFGFYGVAPVNDLLIEDCYFQHYGTNMLFQSTQGLEQNIRVRRNISVDSYGGRSQGAYINGVLNILLEENIFDHNGWSEQVGGKNASIFNHDVYMSAHSDGEIVVRGNIFSNASSHGLQARSGGVIENNLFLRNPIGLLLGNGASYTPGGVVGKIRGNVFLDSRDIAGSTRGYAIDLGNTMPDGGTVIEDNIIAHDTQKAFAGIKLSIGNPPTNLQDAVGLNDVTVRDNIVYDWYQGLSTDTGYVPGASGFKALNDLSVYDNDFQQTISPRLLAHGHPYASDSESWDDNHYWDDSPSSGWFSVQGTAKSFDDWQGNLEKSANRTQRKYLDPNRTIDSYSRSVGGAGTLADFITGARAQSRQNWNPQFTAAAVIDYVRDGFEVDASTPTAGLQAEDVNSLGGAGHTFIVYYADDAGIDPRTLDSGDVRVTGPNGYSQLAKLVSVDRAGTTVRAAVYSIDAPAGGWREQDAGLYTVSTQSGQVADLRGNTVRGGVVGTFYVRGDNQGPSATASSPNVIKAGGKFQSIVVTYTDNRAVDVGSLGAGDLIVMGPNGFEQLATLVSVLPAGNSSLNVGNYSIVPPDGTWDALDDGVYTVSLRPAEVKDTSGNFHPGGVLTTFTVAIVPMAPTNLTVAASDVTSAGGSTKTFKVTCPAGAASTSAEPLQVSGPGGYLQTAAVTSDTTADGNRTLTYSVSAPDGNWDWTDNGAYTIRRAPAETPASESVDPLPLGEALATFIVAIRRDVTPPVIVSAAFSATYEDRLVLRFSEDVSRSLSADDFEIRRAGSTESISASLLKLSYDRHTNRVTISFDGLPGGELGAGIYHLSIRSGAIQDASGNLFDGNRDRVAGGAFSSVFWKA